jgi:hypothetical protein
MDLTHGTVRMTRGSPYMTWLNGRITCGSTDEIYFAYMLTWKGDYVVWT